jgi:hypothetical protein
MGLRSHFGDKWVGCDRGSGYYYNRGYYGRKGNEKVEMSEKGVKLPGIKIG